MDQNAVEFVKSLPAILRDYYFTELAYGLAAAGRWSDVDNALAEIRLRSDYGNAVAPGPACPVPV